MDIITTLYYTLGLILAFNSFFSFLGIHSIKEDLAAINVYKTIYRGVSFKSWPADCKFLIYKLIFITIGFMIWMFFGLFTSQWVLFVGYILLTFILGKINTSNTESLFVKIYQKVWHLFCATYFAFIVVNWKHLHIDVSGIFVEWFMNQW